MNSTWGIIVPIVAIAGGIAIAIISTIVRSRTVTREANVLQEVRALLRDRGVADLEQTRLLLDVDQRLSRIEKTLDQVG